VVPQGVALHKLRRAEWSFLDCLLTLFLSEMRWKDGRIRNPSIFVSWFLSILYVCALHTVLRIDDDAKCGQERGLTMAACFH
jgi:hypothetical protein